MLGVSEIVQLVDSVLPMTGERNMAKEHHAANAAIVKVFILHLLCVLVVRTLSPWCP